jgi:hypothetical protein
MTRRGQMHSLIRKRLGYDLRNLYTDLEKNRVGVDHGHGKDQRKVGMMLEERRNIALTLYYQLLTDQSTKVDQGESAQKINEVVQ